MASDRVTAATDRYIRSLVDGRQDAKIIDFIAELNHFEYNLDLSFAEELLSFVDRHDCCVPNALLARYGVITSSTNLSDHTLRLLRAMDLDEGVDYEVFPNVGEYSERGGRPRKDYRLSPRAFDLCLMRSLNTRKYANYFTLLKTAVARFDKYQRLLAEARASDERARANRLASENSELVARLDAISRRTEQGFGALTVDLGEVKTELNIVKSQNTDLQTGLTIVKGQNTDLQTDLTIVKGQNTDLQTDLTIVKGQNRVIGTKLDTAADLGRASLGRLTTLANLAASKAAEVAPAASDAAKVELLALIRLSPGLYTARRCQKKAYGTARKALRQTYPRLAELAKLEPCPNAKSIFNRLKEQLGPRRVASPTCSSHFTLAPGFTEAELIALTRSVFAAGPRALRVESAVATLHVSQNGAALARAARVPILLTVAEIKILGALIDSLALGD